MGVFGGHEDCFALEVLSSAERFDLLTGAWAPLPPMLTARSKPFVTVVGAQLFVCGGWHGSMQSVCIERFNPATYAWDVLPPVTGPTDCLCAAAVAGQLYVCGGNTIVRLNDGQHVWEALPLLPTNRNQFTAAVGAR